MSNGTVTIGLDGERIEIGAIQAEEAITFTGTVSGDHMSGTWDDGGSCPPPHDGIWEAVRSWASRRFVPAAMVTAAEVGQTSTLCGA